MRQLLLLVLLLFLIGCENIYIKQENKTQDETVNVSQYDLNGNVTLNNTIEENITTVVLVENIFLPPRQDNLSIYIPDIDGQSIIVLKEDTSLLIDAGFEKDAQTVLKTLRNLGIEKLNYAVASNTNGGSIGGLPYIIIQTSPAIVYESGKPSPSSDYKSFKRLVNESSEIENIKVANDDLFLANELFIKLIVAYDDGKGFVSGTDDNSIVVRVSYKDTSFLFMSNCGFNCMERISDDVTISDVIVIDGSCDSTTLSFIQKIKPKVAIANGEVCAETKNRFEYLGVPLYTSEEHGDIRLESDGKNFNLEYLKVG